MGLGGVEPRHADPRDGVETASEPRRRLIGRRLALVALGFVLALAGLEAVLRLAALTVGARGAGLARGSATTILCVGDSHTYGVGVAQQESYPGQLQTALDESGSSRYRVVNLGLPGMSSTEIAARLPEWLDRHRPAIVVFGAGINNLWNRSGTQRLPRTLAWLSTLRVYRLASLLGAALESGPADTSSERPELRRELMAEGNDGERYRNVRTGELLVVHEGDIFGRIPLDEAAARLAGDLERIELLTRSSGARLVLLTYASFPIAGRAETTRFGAHQRMNDEMRRFARSQGLTLVDLDDVVRKLLAPGVRRSEYFLSELDGHPNALGYREVSLRIAVALKPVS